MAKRRKDPTDKKSVPTRANSKMDSNEQEFWNLDDSGDAPAAEEPQDADDPLDDDLEDSDSAEAMENDSDDIDDSGLNEDEDDLDDYFDQEDDDDDPEDVPAPLDGEAQDARPGRDTDPAPEPADTSDKSSPTDRPSSGKTEKIALGILAAVLLIGAIWGIAIFVGSLPEGTTKNNVEFPIQGSFITVAAADTYWRKPDRTKDKGVRMDTRLIPAAVVKLKDGSGSCALRFFFSDDTDELVGDPTTHSIANGKFESSGTNEVEVYGTAGFLDPGDHAAYTTEQIDTWYIVIKEGADRNAPGAEFKEIARIPISFNRK